MTSFSGNENSFSFFLKQGLRTIFMPQYVLPFGASIGWNIIPNNANIDLKTNIIIRACFVKQENL